MQTSLSNRRKLSRLPDHDMLQDRKGTTAAKRPDGPIHSLSFSKRHASFDSPREIPLPSPSVAQTAAMRETQVFGNDDDWELISPGTTKLHKEKNKDKPKPASKSKGQILPHSRPYSLPEAHSYHGRGLVEHEQSTTTPPPPAVDRTSSASLPLPLQIPFSTLPKVRGIPSPVLEREVYLRPPIQSTSSPVPSSSSSSSSSSSGSLPSAPASRSSTPNIVEPPPPPTAQPQQARRGAAPMPPPELTTSNSGSVASYRPPRTTYTPVPASVEAEGATAIRRSASTSSTSTYPPPEPPVIMHGDELQEEVPPPPSLNTTAQRASLTPSTSSRSSGASYEPFLSHAPPPVDSWIEVETTQAEYRLVVRLPGFKRDGITLATKKRRILHVVADSWEEGGGHFERRISFGYDADLAQVRAEFDGELLKVIIPRRMPAGMLGGWVAPVGRAS